MEPLLLFILFLSQEVHCQTITYSVAKPLKGRKNNYYCFITRRLSINFTEELISKASEYWLVEVTIMKCSFFTCRSSFAKANRREKDLLENLSLYRVLSSSSLIMIRQKSPMSFVKLALNNTWSWL